MGIGGIRARSAHLEVNRRFAQARYFEQRGEHQCLDLTVSPAKECKINGMQRLFTAFFFAALFTASGVAPAQPSDSYGGRNYGLEVPACVVQMCQSPNLWAKAGLLHGVRTFFLVAEWPELSPRRIWWHQQRERKASSPRTLSAHQEN
jgi:hypothetical protein